MGRMLDGKSLNILKERVEQLRKLFPNVFFEGKIDFKRLRDELGDEVNFQNEHYELTWAGKSESRKEVQKQTTATLNPYQEQSINFETSQNILIEGENLEVLHVLQRSYHGKIKMIYIDPPYNTGNDSFIYPDDFSERKLDYQIRTGDKDQNRFLNKQDLWKKNSSENGHFHSVWLSMMYPRLYLAKSLLTEDGVICISIDDNEAANLKLVMDEIFGTENFIVNIIWKKRSTPPNDKIIGANHDYIYVYAKNKDLISLNLRTRSDKQTARYKNPDSHIKGPWTPGDLMANVKGGRYVKSLYFPIINPKTGEAHYPSQKGNWRFNQEKIQELIANDEIYFGEDGQGRPKLKRFLSEVKDGITYPSIWDFTPLNSQGSQEIADVLGNMNIFDNPKPVGLIKELIKFGSNENDLILDYFAGSGSTAQAVLELNQEENSNRKFICVQLPELVDNNSEAFNAGYISIADLCRARISEIVQRINKKQAKKVNKDQAGFKFFKLQQSNFKVWQSDLTGEEAILQQLEMFVRSEVNNSIDENMLYELLLKTGLPLTTQIEKQMIAGQKLYSIDNYRFVVFFSHYKQKIKNFILDKKPKQVICLDRVFNNNDELLTNFKLELIEQGIELLII